MSDDKSKKEFTWEDAELVTNSVEDYWRDIGMSKEDIANAFTWTSKLFMHLIVGNFPLRDKRFCEVLRGVAHGMELSIEMDEKNKES